MKLYESGLISRLYSAYNAPEAIILFGSYGKGEDTSKSDIDLAVITKRRIKLGLGKYENALKRKIQVFEMETGKVDKNMLTSLANGIVLEGYLSLP
ncbi:nucleotidyltransferase domain-containing protein [Candidatus Woesearchaeota archaeon]|nr:nucleotidyltransferase domain-containing protein [Candidatus Woesearchaeota archaeon]